MRSPQLHSLEQAATIIEKAIDQLDDSGKTCRCCGLHVYNKFAEATLKRDLGTMAAKLRRVAREGIG